MGRKGNRFLLFGAQPALRPTSDQGLAIHSAVSPSHQARNDHSLASFIVERQSETLATTHIFESVKSDESHESFAAEHSGFQRLETLAYVTKLVFDHHPFFQLIVEHSLDVLAPSTLQERTNPPALRFEAQLLDHGNHCQNNDADNQKQQYAARRFRQAVGHGLHKTK